jgi:glycine betaine/proline transport system substrate-binding protein
MGARKRVRLSAGLVALSLVVSGCNGFTSGDAAPVAKRGVVKLAVNPWVGYEANAAVVAYLLEHELHYEVEKKALAEDVSWQGFETGEVDLIMENWGHEDLKDKYIRDKKVATEVGFTGNKGVIGWYVPKWMVEAYPAILNWRGLNRHTDLFKTPESGGKGQLLDGDPTFVTNDESLVRNLGLNYKVVYSGSEEATIKAALEAAEKRKPLLFYFYEPQWLHSKAEFVRIGLPTHEDGCDVNTETVACGYPEYILDKIMRIEFARKNPDVYELVENFSWSNAEQNEVAGYIANDGMKPEEAAEKWVKENRRTWEIWLSQNS